MRSILLCTALFWTHSAVAQTQVWTQSLAANNDLNGNRIAHVERLPDGNILVDVQRRSFRFEMTVLAADSGIVTTSRVTDHFNGFDSSSILTSAGDLVRYAVTLNSWPPRGRLSSIDTVTGELNWELTDQPLRYELNTDDAGNVYVLEHGDLPSLPLQLKRYASDGVATAIGTMATTRTMVVPLAQAEGMPGWVISTVNGREICRLTATIHCTAIQLPLPNSIVRRIHPAADGGFYVEILDHDASPRFGLARYSASGERLWHEGVSNTLFGWDPHAEGVALMLADDPNCTAGQLGMRTLALSGAPDTLAVCQESHGFEAEFMRIVDLGSRWLVKHSWTSTPRIIDKITGGAYWLRLPPVYGHTVAYGGVVPLADGEFVALGIGWLDQSSARIHARRIRLGNTLFSDNFEFFAR